MTTRLYEHSIFKEHVTPPSHPERVDRLRALEEALTAEPFQLLERVEAPRADESAVLLAHPEKHLESVKTQMPEEGFNRIDEDTVANPKTFDASMHGLGAAMSAVDAVIAGDVDNAFIAARPPGHHAEKTTAMGFCVFNTVAVAARHAQCAHGLERVAIVDFDVHHGNGTQDIFWDDSSVLFCSTHQMPLYPGSGAKTEEGAHANIINAPLSPGDAGEHFREAFKSRVLTALDDFRPELIIVSAGFDAHHRDPLAQINLVEDDFDWVTGRLMDAAGRHCDNRIVSSLEGGYDLQGLATSAATHIHRLMRG
ncbi:MAG: histone deacetylase family protein [Pseudomonadota bacterium]